MPRTRSTRPSPSSLARPGRRSVRSPSRSPTGPDSASPSALTTRPSADAEPVRPHRARSRRPPPARRGTDQPGDRRGAVHLAQDRERARSSIMRKLGVRRHADAARIAAKTMLEDRRPYQLCPQQVPSRSAAAHAHRTLRRPCPIIAVNDVAERPLLPAVGRYRNSPGAPAPRPTPASSRRSQDGARRRARPLGVSGARSRPRENRERGRALIVVALDR